MYDQQSQRTRPILEKGRRLILIENNATSQFGRILTMETGIGGFETILKYSGLPFTVEELMKRISTGAPGGNKT